MDHFLLRRILPVVCFLSLLLATSGALWGQALESHLSEAGSSVIFVRSAFAHGYRHGYEEGYHQGNIDINMGRAAKSKPAQPRGASLGYAPEFGPRKPFQEGFGDGFMAGYGDGYAGRPFRAVESLRRIAAMLNEEHSFMSSNSEQDLQFDGGFSSGYNDGLAGDLQNHSVNAAHAVVDCGAPQPGRPAETSGRQTFCEGYRLGYTLGSADGEARLPEPRSIQASR